ncbi:MULTISPECIES: ABC transporter ATP-binding protein [Devosia]|uniref:Oligopeptide transport ATP-binding protein OppD n=1 Tax=Devosia equisanguinis TaxID=2490941 RepID=A0A447ICE3_9HYPH|nr:MULTISPECIES: ABC transporter ATP-binding protein [Devosia]ODT47281.1 MAG: ABC transporter [Pelagibacterium sp. SCN 63-126]ODU84680.1 MAG: ABC transporter [Pelagibacterium sp. SCN 63-17]OJX43011.1 MAG: ABC transporter ATP-binding protein [Devosia sp. 63-57]VDS05145.1 Oligopeptide transport ATP-binding protein OppD [Devosia equisanguinis]
MSRDSKEDVLKVEGLKAYYQMNYFGVSREVRAVDGITMNIKKGEVYGIAGESSSGKTSFIKVLAAAIRPPLRVVDGTVKYNFKSGPIDVAHASPAQIEAVRWKNLSYIMQGSMSVLNPVRKIGKTFHDFAARPLGLSGKAFEARVLGHLERLKLPAEVLNAYPHELSGGMRQRVTIGLATVCHPEFIIADEPTTALDVVVQKEVLSLIRDIQAEMNSSVVFVTHDMSVHANVADRVGIIYAGRLVEEGPTRQMFFTPKHPYTAHLVASLPRIGDTQQRPALEGRPPNLADPPSGCRFHPRCPLAVDKCKQEAPPMEVVAPDQRSACWRWQDVKPLVGAAKPAGVMA